MLYYYFIYDLRDSSSWSSSPLMLLRDIHSKFIDQYDCKDVCTSSPSQVNAGDRARPSCQEGVPQQQETAPLSLPQVNRLFEASFAWDESSASTAGVVTNVRCDRGIKPCRASASYPQCVFCGNKFRYESFNVE
jgi:hypothetical protein